MARLGGRPLIEWVLRRTLAATEIDRVVLATSNDTANDDLAAVAQALAIDVIRGDENDVLSRFVTAAGAYNAEWIVRICADNPFIDGRELDRLVTFTAGAGADYTFNHLDRLNNRYADGFGAEMVNVAALRTADREATSPADREHVTTYVWQRPERFAVRTLLAPVELQHPALRFDIDTPDDLTALEPLAALGISATAGAFVSAENERRQRA